MDIQVTNPSAQNCTFDLAYTSALGLPVSGPSAWYVPAMNTDTFTVTVNVPFDAVQGETDKVTVAASCREQTMMGTTSFMVGIENQVLMPFIGK